MATESHKERQEDELQVLQAIFMTDLKDLRENDAWKIDRPPEICITLKPQQSIGNIGGENYVQLDLMLKCPEDYPDSAPTIKIENSKGISNQQIINLKKDLEKRSKELCGEEMLLELSQVVQQFLYTNNKPPAKSFYEEMMSNKQKEEERIARERQKTLEIRRKREEKEMQIIEGQIQKRKEELKEETRKRREETRQASRDRDHIEEEKYHPLSVERKSDSPSPTVIRQISDPTQSNRRRTITPRCADEEGNQCKHHAGGIVELTFGAKPQRNIHRGTCLGHGLQGSTVYVGIDTRTGELVAISESVLKWRHAAKKSNKTDRNDLDKESETYMKQIMSIEQEMSSLLKLSHRNLLHYLAMKYSEEPGKISVNVLLEYSGGQNLDIYLTGMTLYIDILRAYTAELLEALNYLHTKAVVHKNIRASSVFVDMNGQIRLADYSINKRLSDLHNMIEASKPGTNGAKKHIPSYGRAGKKGDIHELGILVLSLAQGSQVKDMIPTIPTTLPSTLQDFLSKCLLPDEKLRWSSNQLLEHTFVKEPIIMSPHLQQPLENNQVKEKVPKKENSFEEEEDLHPLITAWEASGHSRLTSEFDVIKSLGKGGFGDVLKVKNKLDGRLYAIKRIPLNPKSQQFNRKITREVKLLSRLSHENVVRYYNSWIETSDEPVSSESSSSFSGTPKNSTSEKKVSLPSHFPKNSLDLLDDIEKNVPQFSDISMDFSISYEASRSRSHGVQDTSSDSSDSEYEDDPADMFGIFMDENLDDSSSDNIVFEHNFDEEEDTQVSEIDSQKNKLAAISETFNIIPKQYLYIQMEYCEKSTLRNCIDDGLHKDMDRVWRLFREIVEGLVHIHGQGMIHRDLKPVNIFLDSYDQVKIGDFGLATSDIIPKGNILDTAMLMTSAGDIHDSLSGSGGLGDGNLTGMVGTALYVSPEMMVKSNKITYSQKVDIYSLGIIFFEMCFKPLTTGMERVQILGNLRLNEIKFPEEFNVVEMETQYKLLQWILNHDPNERPSSKELLQSKYIPPPQMEEEELNEVLQSTISDPQSKSYHRLMNKLFSQNVTVADDHVYDSDVHKSSFSLKSSLTHRMVMDTLVKVFQLHGAIKLSTPLLIPRPKMYESVDLYPCLMDHSGRLVGLPFDLRMPFARYVVRTSIHHVKRYCIEKVYRKRKGCGFHPRELIECAFDIVTSKADSLIPDAEVMVVAQDIVNEFPPLQQRNYYFRVNHTSLLKAALLHAGITEDKHLSVLSSLSEVKRDTKSTHKLLANMSVTEQSSSLLMNILEIEGSITKVSSALKTITKTKGQAGSLAKQGLHEMEAVITNAQYLGLKMPVIVSVGWILNSPTYNGVVFQLVNDVTRNKKLVSEMLAAGGRYDHLINQFRSMREISFARGVGLSIAFEKIVSAFLEQKDFQPQSAYDILVCTIGHKPMLKERMAIARELWNARLKAEILHETLEGIEEIQDFCRVHGVSYLVILKDSEGSTNLKVRSIEKERVTEKVLLPSKLVEFLTQRLHHSDEVEQKSTNQTSVGKNNNSQDNVNQQQSSGCNIVPNTTFLIQDGKLAYNLRKRYESNIAYKISTCYPWLSSVKSLEVVALDLTVTALRAIAGFLDIDSTEKAFNSSIGAIVEKHPRHKKYIEKIMDHIHSLVFEQQCSCVLLYGLKDESVKLLTST